jgi:hypothetical protein
MCPAVELLTIGRVGAVDIGAANAACRDYRRRRKALVPEGFQTMSARL